MAKAEVRPTGNSRYNVYYMNRYIGYLIPVKNKFLSISESEYVDAIIMIQPKRGNIRHEHEWGYALIADASAYKAFQDTNFTTTVLTNAVKRHFHNGVKGLTARLYRGFHKAEEKRAYYYYDINNRLLCRTGAGAYPSGELGLFSKSLYNDMLYIINKYGFKTINSK